MAEYRTHSSRGDERQDRVHQRALPGGRARLDDDGERGLELPRDGGEVADERVRRLADHAAPLEVGADPGKELGIAEQRQGGLALGGRHLGHPVAGLHGTRDRGVLELLEFQEHRAEVTPDRLLLDRHLERLGVSQPIVSDYERGELRLHGELIVTLADLLGVSTDELLGRAARSPRGTAVKNRRLLRRIQEIDRLPKRDQQALLRTIDAFLTRAAS
jgi:transcriptional regulator with XRE-family HTH domain